MQSETRHCKLSGNHWMCFKEQQMGLKLKLFECHVTTLDWQHGAGGNVVIHGLLNSLIHRAMLTWVVKGLYTSICQSLFSSSISPPLINASIHWKITPFSLHLQKFSFWFLPIMLTVRTEWNVWKLPSVTVFVFNLKTFFFNLFCQKMGGCWS